MPVGGGRGTNGLSRTPYVSEAATVKVWQNSGATYDLQVIQDADHSVDAINAQIIKVESQTLVQKMTHFFGLSQP